MIEQTTTTKISKTDMEKEKRLEHTLVSVYNINNKQYVVAYSIEEAIKLYKNAYEWPYDIVKTVELIDGNAWIKSDKDDEKSE